LGFPVVIVNLISAANRQEWCDQSHLLGWHLGDPRSQIRRGQTEANRD